MARNRMITPEFFLDEGLAELSANARLLYIGLWQIADDINATLPHRPKWIKAQVFPYESIKIESLLEELIKANKLLPFEYESEAYLYIKNFRKHQRVEKPSTIRKYPEYSGNPPQPLPYHSYTPLDEVKISKEKISEAKIREIDVFISFFNEKSGKDYRVTDDRTGKLKKRLEKYSMDEIKRATEALLKSPYHTGRDPKGNPSNTWYASPEFILRNDDQIDKWLNSSTPSKLPVNKKPEWLESIPTEI